MSNKQTIPYSNLPFYSVMRANKAWLRLPFPFLWTNSLIWQQWLVLFGLGWAVVLLEVRNHAMMWHEHQTNQTILTDQELVWEMVIFGLILPLLAGLILGYTSRTALERDKITQAMQLRQALVAQLHNAQSWQELTELIVMTPGNVVHADRTWLLSQRSGDAEFTAVAQWERANNSTFPVQSTIAPAACQQCAVAATDEAKIFTCSHLNSSETSSKYIRYCRWLSFEETGKSALLIDVPHDRPLNVSQIQVLDDIGDEMSLVIINANLQYDRQRQLNNVMNERQRIARNLHDTLGQNISFLRLKLEQLNDNLLAQGDANLQSDLSKMVHAAEEAYEQVRDTLEELRAVKHIDLEESIRQYADQASKRSKFAINVHVRNHIKRFSVRHNRQIMYIVREALNNVEKHANAQNVEIDLQWGNDEFVMIIQDDGVGFYPFTIHHDGHYGLLIMHERANAINAKLSIESMPSQGTKLTLYVPETNNPLSYQLADE